MIVEGKINVGNVRVYPQLEDLEVTPNNQEQVFTHENSYGYDNVRVKAIDIQLQNKEVTPSKEVQRINADSGYTGLNEVVVNEIPSDYIIPTGTKEITSNGTTNIKEYENVNVNVTYTSEEKTVTPTKEVQNVTPTSADYLSKVVVNAIPDNYIEPTGTENITANGTYDITTKASVNVNVPSEEVNLQEKSVSVATNGSVEVTADSGYTGLSKVNVSNTQELEEVSVTPTTEIQTITPTSNKLINQVNVSAVDSSIDSNIVASNIKNGVQILGVTGTLNEGITPTGELAITENGTYDVTNYASANVNVEGSGGADLNEYFETTYSGTSPSAWVKNNLIKKTPDLVIDDSVTSLAGFCSGMMIVPKIICNSNVTNMNELYKSCSAATIDASGLNTSNIKYLYSLFHNCYNLTSLDLSNFNTSKAEEICNTFYGCSKLTSLNLSSFDTSNTRCMQYTFESCQSLTSLDLSNFNTSKVYTMDYLFDGCRSLKNLDIRNFDFTKVTSYTDMFRYVPTDCLIIVKDDTAKTWITSKFTTLTNVKTVAEL